MIMQSYTLDLNLSWIILCSLSLLWVCLGFYWGKRSKSYEGFVVAGRSVGLALGTATAVATWITSNTTLLAPQFALQMGVWGMIAYSTAALGLFLFSPLAHRIQKLMPGGFTSGDFIKSRYGTLTWLLFLLISLFYALTWLVSMGMAGGLLLEVLGGIPYAQGVTVILLTCVGYTLVGGMYAVIGTDFIQSLIILIGLAVIAWVVWSKIDITQVHASLVAEKPALLWVFFPAAMMAVFNNLMFGIGEIFHSNVWWSRAFAIRPGIGGKAYLYGGMLWLPIPIVAGFIALATPELGINAYRPDVIGPLVASALLGKVGAILVFMVVFCSLASSIDSLLAATSDLLTQDIVRKIFKPQATHEELRKVSSLSVIGLGLIAWLVCLPKVGTLAEVLFFAGPLVGSTIWPILAGLYWRRASAEGAFFGMLLGSIIGLWTYFSIGWYAGSLCGTAVSMLTVILFAWLRPGTFHWKNLQQLPSEGGAS